MCVCVCVCVCADHTALDKKDPHYDPRSTSESPRWFMVDVRLVRKFPRCVTLDEVKACAQLADMPLVKRGRISVTRVSPDEWKCINDMAEEDAPELPSAKKTKKAARRAPKSKKNP